ncbi:MAG TPA: hypothetical protein VFC25_10585 [Verrucomicrobiae bacterium]|nr:hypothetical protein [Verrucomicrobiae bacterium]
MNGESGEVLVGRDNCASVVELQVWDRDEERSRIARLTGDEARRLAAQLLFQAARLDRARLRFAAGTPRHLRAIA